MNSDPSVSLKTLKTWFQDQALPDSVVLPKKNQDVWSYLDLNPLKGKELFFVPAFDQPLKSDFDEDSAVPLPGHQKIQIFNGRTTNHNQDVLPEFMKARSQGPVVSDVEDPFWKLRPLVPSLFFTPQKSEVNTLEISNIFRGTPNTSLIKENAFSVTHVIIHVPENCVLHIKEKITAENQGLSLGYTDYYLAPGARVTVERLQEASGQNIFQMQYRRVFLQANAEFESLGYTRGGKLNLFQQQIFLDGLKSCFKDKRFYQSDQNEQVVERLEITHKGVQSQSHQSFKGIVGHQGRGGFQGQVTVLAGATDAQARQLHRTLLLDDTARGFSLPQLKVEESQVQCSHGSTISQFNPQELFYLQSRGLNETTTMNFMVKAFSKEILGSSAWLEKEFLRK